MKKFTVVTILIALLAMASIAGLAESVIVPVDEAMHIMMPGRAVPEFIPESARQQGDKVIRASVSPTEYLHAIYCIPAGTIAYLSADECAVSFPMTNGRMSPWIPFQGETFYAVDTWIEFGDNAIFKLYSSCEGDADVGIYSLLSHNTTPDRHPLDGGYIPLAFENDDWPSAQYTRWIELREALLKTTDD